LPTHIAPIESVLFVRADEKLTAFLELQAAIRKRPVENEEHIDKLQENPLAF
jgi:hypothetical protein